MIDKFFGIAASIVIVAGMTTLVLPGRQTTGVVREGGNAFSNALKAATGR
jgi:hypothetical protein